MNTTQFSEFLQSLLVEIHNRAVEQYSKTEAVNSGPTVALAARQSPMFISHLGKPNSNSWPTWPETQSMTSSMDERPMFKRSFSSVCPTQKNVVHNRSICLPHTGKAQQPTLERSSNDGFFPEREESWFNGIDDENGVGFQRSVTVYSEMPRSITPPTRKSLTMEDTRSFMHTVIARKSSWVIHPESARMQNWDAITLLVMAFVAFVSPIQVAFMEAQMDTMFVINCIVDCVFVVDMIIQFFLMYYVKTGHGRRLEHRQSMIAKRYLKSWFVVDFLSVLPFDLLAILLQSSNLQKAKGLKTVRILRVLKMLRILRASRIFKRLETSLLVTNTYQVFDLNMFIVYLILILHWLACLWAMTLSLVDDDSVRWIDTFENSESGVAEKTKDTAWKQYVAALYFAAYTMTSVGYGDVTPANIVERIVCILILIISGLVWARVIGKVTNIVGNLEAQEQEFRSLMDNVNSMMRDRTLPRSVRKRVLTFFLSARQAQRNEQQEQILHRMSPMLQGEVALRSNWYWVRRISLVSHFMPEGGLADETRAPYFVVDIAVALGSLVFAQSELFGEQRALCIIKQGLALARAGYGMRVFSEGSVWGEDFVLSKSSLRESVVCLAMTYMEVFQLKFASFIRICHKHSSSLVLRKLLRKYVVRLSARRAILVEARWRRRAVLNC